jgi:hypothetical protein
VDRKSLALFQKKNDVTMAERTLKAAFEIDVSAIVAEVRRRKGCAHRSLSSPIANFKKENICRKHFHLAGRQPALPADLAVEFLKLATTAAAASRGRASIHSPQPPPKNWNRPSARHEKISLQISTKATDEDLQFAQQLGVEYINIPTGGADATLENFIHLKQRVEAANLKVWNIGNSNVSTTCRR